MTWVVALASHAAGVAASVVEECTQSRVPDYTGTIDGTWIDLDGVSWQIEQDGPALHLVGRLGTGRHVIGTGSRHGRRLRARWDGPTGGGAIVADIGAGGSRITGKVSSHCSVHPFVLIR